MDDQVCEKFCDFYKPGRKEKTRCGSYEFIRRNLTMRELKRAAETADRNPDRSADASIRELACQECGFMEDGCDFRAGLDSPPCGGYAIVSYLLKQSATA